MLNKTLKSILPGLIPLFIFIIADELWGTTIGIYVALAVGVLELGYTYFKTKKIEKFILADTLLLVALGAISIFLDNDIFFKLKPALIESILAIIIAFSAFGGKNIILNMSRRYLKGMEISQTQSKLMQKSLKGIFYIIIVHIILVVYSAYFMSKEAWAFISGGLFYILFAVYFIAEYIRNKQSQKKHAEELLPHIDEHGKVLGIYPRSNFHDSDNYKMVHPVVHVHVVNSKGEIYLQKRPMNKLIQPGKWDTAVGGHISAGEDLELALKRETQEEIGLENINFQFIKNYIWETDIEKELVYMFIAQTDQTPEPSKTELEEGKFWSKNKINQHLSNNIFTPNFIHEFNMLDIYKVQLKL